VRVRLIGAILVAAVLVPAAHAGTPRVLAIRFGPDLEVNPVTKDYVNHQLSQAEKHYDAAVILLDTPGGLSSSMRSIYQKELSLKIPVIVYVSPSGARAASAGVWIAEAADVLAMSPVSNIGSSTPIDSSGGNLNSDLRRKVINDAAASLRALAAEHKRNTTWPVLAVTKASNLTARQALRMNVIDTIAPSLPALLRQLDGYRTKDAQRPFTLHLARAEIHNVGPGFFTRLLNTIIDPNLISLLFLAGLAGIIFEVLHPGVVLPGALGGVSLIIALYGFSVLNPSWSGIVLMLLGVSLLVIDLHATSHGALTIAGLIALGFGLALLFKDQPATYHVNLWIVVGIGSAIAALWVFIAGKAYATRKLPVQVGAHTLIGADGEVRRDGLVFLNGELWQARTSDGSELVPGEHVVVESVDGLELTVRPTRPREPVA
jgi:membrane-bound serine protease (ClpP class)